METFKVDNVQIFENDTKKSEARLKQLKGIKFGKCFADFQLGIFCIIVSYLERHRDWNIYNFTC